MTLSCISRSHYCDLLHHQHHNCRCLCYGQVGTNDYMYYDYSIVILHVSFFQGLMFEYLES